MNKYIVMLTLAYLWLCVAFLVGSGAYFLDEALLIKTRSVSGKIINVDVTSKWGVQGQWVPQRRGWARPLYIQLVGDKAYYHLPRFFFTVPSGDTLRKAKHVSLVVNADAQTMSPDSTQQPLRPKVTHTPDRRFHVEYLRQPDAPVLSYDITAITLDGTPYLTLRSYRFEMMGRVLLLWAMAGVMAWGLRLLNFPSLSGDSPKKFINII